MRTLFIADIHLSAERTDITHSFMHFMHHEARLADRIYILGDLFEFWIGDDDCTPFHLSVMDEFKKLTDSGVRVYFMRGNRDFLIGKEFSQKTGVVLLEDETVIKIKGTRVLLMHGDTLCTDDHKYQKYRRRVSQPWLQWLFLRLPLSFRRRLGAKIHAQSAKDKAQKSQTIMDVNAQAVRNVMKKHQVNYLIHGHTHRPKIHAITAKPVKQRIVLGDWFTTSSVTDAADLDI